MIHSQENNVNQNRITDNTDDRYSRKVLLTTYNKCSKNQQE